MTVKKSVSIALSLALILCFLASCVTSEDDVSVEISQEEISENVPHETEETTEEESKEHIANNPFVEETNIAGLYKFVPQWFNEFDGVNFFFDDATGIIRYELYRSGLFTADTKIYMYSTKENKLLGSLKVDRADCAIVSLKDSGFALVESHKSVELYDSTATLTESHDISDDIACDIMSPAISDDCKTMVYVDSSDGLLYSYSFDTKESKAICDEPLYIRSVTVSENRFYILNENGLYVYDSAEDAFSPVIENTYIVLFNDEYILDQGEKRLVMTSMASDGLTEIKDYKGESIVAATSDYIIIDDGAQENNRVYIYDINTETVYAQSVEGFALHACICDGVLYMICYNADGEGIHYISKLKNGESFAINETDTPYNPKEDIYIPPVVGNDDVIETTERIIEKYGVRVIFEATAIEQCFSREGVTFSPLDAENETFYDNIHQKLLVLESFLKILPDGMIKELMNEDMGELWVAFATDIVSDISASGIADSRVIIIDAELPNADFKQVFYHELMHVIERNVTSMWVDAWVALLPDDVSIDGYFYSYTSDRDYKYTDFDNGNSEVWFYDEYSRTYPSEDMARIFEHLCTSHFFGNLDAGLEYQNLRTKARFLCVMIRLTLESCVSADILPWEEFLGDIDIHEFDNILAEKGLI